MPHRLTLLLIAGLFSSLTARADSVALFVLSGQSNAQGWAGDAAKYPKDDDKLDAEIPLYWHFPSMSDSGEKWVSMGPQKGRFPAGHFGPEVTFARALLRDQKSGKTAERPAIFKYTLGSTSVATFWKTPGAGGHYDKMTAELGKAVASLEEQGHTVRIAGFIWIQGESDSDTPEHVRAYEPALTAIVKDFRARFGAKMPVILGVDEQHGWVKKNPGVIAAQQHLAAENPPATTTTMIGLPKADGTHLTPAGLETQGEWLYKTYRTLAPTK